MVKSRAFPLAVLAAMFLMFAAMLSNVGCIGSGGVRRIEEMEPADLATVEARVDLLVRVLAARVVESNPGSAGALQDAATYLEIAAGDPLALGGPHSLTSALARAGFSDQEAMLALLLVEDFLRSRFDMGDVALPLGPNARALMMTVAGALRASVAGVTEAEQALAAPMLEEVQNAH